ncbi:hypothetical protein F9B85_09330 [Heliorestis acidaminivorans]|uniref:Aminotransferase class V domain-containing protein n=1 Tax=Heliorestis acidaminivorans TaxID=553427 RepID=A0A6I0F537_9FIRM|nr:aminotransferase class V-fold PLP-dependent enzyme [Heliorestis acidaminivorans]KAB2952347.1 hypothetical protein F9B85_09330 [Heliorestis acidaminivorans]
MANAKYKFQLYRHLQASIPQIYGEAKKMADEIGIPPEIRGKFGLTGAISGCPAPLRKDVAEATERGGNEVIPLAKLVDEIREIVKDVYGDEWDVAPTSTCEAALWLCFDTLMTPPNLGRGDNYRARYIAPYEKHMHHQAAYGRPFPPKYKDLYADRGTTAGEYGFYGKRQNNLDTVIVPLAGAKYPVHGIKAHPVPLLTEVDPESAIEQMALAAEVHAPYLTGFTSIGYDTPGYGYGVKDEDGSPLLMKRIGELAHEYNVPFLVDNAWGIPFVGTDPRKVNADLIVYAMDKAAGAATSGLVIGREDLMVSVRRAIGMQGDRWGTTASYGKAAYVTFDPGKEALLSQVQALRTLRDNPEIMTRPVDDLERIVKEEFEKLNPKIRQGIIISKSYNSQAVEVNYEGTWKNNEIGFPIFAIEDMYAGSNILQTGLAQMGVIPTIAYDANIYISPGLGTTDEHGQIIENNMRYGVRALVQLMEIVGRHAGLV